MTAIKRRLPEIQKAFPYLNVLNDKDAAVIGQFCQVLDQQARRKKK